MEIFSCKVGGRGSLSGHEPDSFLCLADPTGFGGVSGGWPLILGLSQVH